MSGVEEDRLYGLMEIAERQQAAVGAALEGLAAERTALRRERETLAHEVATLDAGIRMAVRLAMADSLAGAATDGVAAVRTATGPLLGELAGMAARAGQVEAALRAVVRWASWRLLGWGVAALAGLVLLGWVASGAALWWDKGAIEAAQARKAQLAAEVDALQATHDGWVKAGMLGRLDQCGPKARPCIRVDESAGRFGNGNVDDYRVIQGY